VQFAKDSIFETWLVRHLWHVN